MHTVGMKTDGQTGQSAIVVIDIRPHLPGLQARAFTARQRQLLKRRAPRLEPRGRGREMGEVREPPQARCEFVPLVLAMLLIGGLATSSAAAGPPAIAAFPAGLDPNSMLLPPPSDGRRVKVSVALQRAQPLGHQRGHRALSADRVSAGAVARSAPHVISPPGPKTSTGRSRRIRYGGRNSR